MSDDKPQYPFKPSSYKADLIPGQFWALPLSDGSFGCGRVVQLMPNVRAMFLAAVLDWHSAEPPAADSIASAPCIAQGQAHLKAITESGGTILGFRALDEDGIEPWLFRGATGWINSHVQRGLLPVRPQKPEDSDLPVISTWGYQVAVGIAERRFVKPKDAGATLVQASSPAPWQVAG